MISRRGFIARTLALASAATVTKSLSNSVTPQQGNLASTPLNGNQSLCGNEESIGQMGYDPELRKLREHYRRDTEAGLRRTLDEAIMKQLVL